jgi:hypothetical protein
MPPRSPCITRIVPLALFALLSSSCAEPKRDRTEPPASQTEGGGGSSSSGSQCVSGGPSVSVNIRGRAGGDDMPSDELGTLLGWIGGFAQPCRQATPEAPRFTLEILLGAAGEKPTLTIPERDALPGLAACLDDTFAKAPPPPPGPMTVEIVVPWGCPTLGANFQPEESPKPEAAAAEPSP